MQLTSDAYPLFPNLLAGEFGLGGSLPLRLFGQSGLVTPPGRDAVADEPGRGQRQEGFDAAAAGDAFLTANVAYTSVPPRAAALAAAAAIDTGLGRREAAKYEANPSMTPSGNAATPLAMTSPFPTVAAASTVNGQRRSSVIGLQATPARRSSGPR